MSYFIPIVCLICLLFVCLLLKSSLNFPILIGKCSKWYKRCVKMTTTTRACAYGIGAQSLFPGCGISGGVSSPEFIFNKSSVRIAARRVSLAIHEIPALSARTYSFCCIANWWDAKLAVPWQEFKVSAEMNSFLPKLWILTLKLLK